MISVGQWLWSRIDWSKILEAVCGALRSGRTVAVVANRLEVFRFLRLQAMGARSDGGCAMLIDAMVAL